MKNSWEVKDGHLTNLQAYFYNQFSTCGRP
jgi:hypothetical protein